MKVDYNPQVGYRRTIFKEAYDFLLKPVSFSAKQDGLQITVETYQGKSAEVQVCFLTETAFRLQLIPEGETDRPGNPVFVPETRYPGSFSEQERFCEYGTEKLTLRFCRD